MPLVIEIKVVPQSGQQKIMLDKSGLIKCHVKSAPEDGKANREIIKMLADKLDVPMGQVSIIAGATSRKKLIKIEADITKEQAYIKLGLENQQRIS